MKNVRQWLKIWDEQRQSTVRMDCFLIGESLGSVLEGDEHENLLIPDLWSSAHQFLVLSVEWGDIQGGGQGAR